MKQIFLLLALYCMIQFNTESFSQTIKIQLESKKTGCEILSSTTDSLKMLVCINEIELIEQKIKTDFFYKLKINEFEKIFGKGNPEIPVLNKIIEIPIDAKIKYRIISYVEQIIDLKNYHIIHPIYPAQQSVDKNQIPDSSIFYFDQKLYQTDSFINEKIIKYSEIGIMRDSRLGKLEVNPILYNPKRSKLKILNNLKIEIVFEAGSISKTIKMKEKFQSPFFSNYLNKSINSQNFAKISKKKSLITSNSIKYVLISDAMFKDALQPFINWKQKKGFQVIEAYTDNPLVGKTTTSIKNYLQNLYNNPPEGEQPPTFVLLVGDIAQIPSFESRVTGRIHFTDLYYFDYTNDHLPDVFYGRFSANSVAQLLPQINKTIEYEQYTNIDHKYLRRSLLISGVDEYFAIDYGNGAVNYLNNNYTKKENGIDTSYSYMYKMGIVPSESKNTADSIRKNLKNGAGIVYYTAHCTPLGWKNPQIVISDVQYFENYQKYPLVISNCCESARFEGECFAEEIMRADKKGAIGYIGASDYSIWDEDYYWAVGVRNPINKNPEYDYKNLGAFDRLYHMNNEPISDWFITQGQIPIAGNMAVEASSSQNKLYYWEIYHLFGDPSVMNYLKEPDAINVEIIPAQLSVGATNLSIKTQAFAYIALSQNGKLLATSFSDVNGNAVLNFLPLSSSIAPDIVITAQNKQPYIGKINLAPADKPYIVFKSLSSEKKINYGETIPVEITIENIAGTPYNATNVKATLSTESQYISSISDNFESFETVNAKSIVSHSNAFEFKITDNCPDQQIILFNLTITGEYNSKSYTWTSRFEIIVNALYLSAGNLTVNDKQGNNNGVLDPAEKAILQIPIKNTGHADAKTVNSYLTFKNLPETNLVIENSLFQTSMLKSNESIITEFSVIAENNAPVGTKIDLIFKANIGNTNQYQIIIPKTIGIGILPEFYINHKELPNSVATCIGKFYDSGGKDGTYSDFENDTLTFVSTSPESMVRVSFNSFDLEDKYDKLYIYDGASTKSPQITGSPFTGINSPGIITSASGALTFVFISDGSNKNSGWDADISCYRLTSVPSCASNPSPESGKKEIFPTILSWSSTDASLYDVYIGTNNPPPYFVSTQSASLPIDLKVKTQYYWKVIAKNFLGTATGCTDLWTFTTGTGMYTIANKTISTCEGYFYDSGGPNNDYSINEDYTMTFVPSIEGKLIEVEFTDWEIENEKTCEFDYFEAYNGISTRTERFGRFCESQITSRKFTATNSEGALTFKFHSDGAINKKGWIAQIRCVTPTGFDENRCENQISIIPNPNSGNFKIIIKEGDWSNSIVSVSCIDGKKIFEQFLPLSPYYNYEIPVNLSKYSKGIYFLKINNQKQTVIKKIVIR